MSNQEIESMFKLHSLSFESAANTLATMQKTDTSASQSILSLLSIVQYLDARLKILEKRIDLKITPSMN